MYHDKGDRNGASSNFFFTPLNYTSTNVYQLNQLPIIQQLNSKYSLFAYVIEGYEVLDNLKPGDIIQSTVVEDGFWDLLNSADENYGVLVSPEDIL